MEIFPGNIAERCFASGVVLMAMMVTATVVSAITDMMIQVQKLKNDRTMQEHTLRNYLKEHMISTELSVRVKLHIQNQTEKEKKSEAETKVLASLSKNLLLDLLFEARAPTFVFHTFFLELQRNTPRALRMICSK